LVGHPAADLVLVNDDDLTYAKLRLDERSLATLRGGSGAGIGSMPDSLARALCWSAVWDMTRDAEAPARDWVALVLAGVDAETDAEAARDATATGVRRAATARALRPTAEAKERAWQQAFHDDDIPNAVHEALLAGFWHPAQRELTAGYVERYFADIRPLWDR